MKKYAVPEYALAKDIKRVRSIYDMTQKEFADFIGVSKPTIERWEASKDKITGPIVFLLSILEENTQYINNLIIPPKKYPTRMFYMHGQKISTLIDVNMITQKIYIKNYTDNIIFRAFGVNENPTYDDFQEFLESRCFPKTRDKLKLYLRELDIPFYDPLTIIEKTEGKMADDDFWIKMED